METKQTLIKMENLSYSINGKLILRNINTEIKDIVGRGQIIALLGPSGCGKTTLFNLLSGFATPTTGKISVHLEKEGLEEVNSHVMGVVTQAYPLFEHRTILSNLLMVAKSLPDGKNALVQVMEHLARFGLTDHAEKFPCQLSGGQRQRVAIIQQILCSEKYILMDEPFSGLDMIAKCDVCHLIRDVASMDEENTIIIVTHGIEDALKVADTIWMLGRDKDENGAFIPGAYFKKQISLIDRGLSMDCCAVTDPKYFELIKEIQRDFVNL